jgi:hypothetical protein
MNTDMLNLFFTKYCVYLRECELYNIVEDLLAEHDEEELDRQLEPTARGITLRIVSHCTENPI